MITSKLTTKSQTTIPQSVRSALQLKAGDEIAYVIEGTRVTLTRVRSNSAADDPFALFDEWAGEADEAAYADL